MQTLKTCTNKVFGTRPFGEFMYQNWNPYALVYI